MLCAPWRAVILQIRARSAMPDRVFHFRRQPFSLSGIYTIDAMNATKRIIVREEVWADLSSMRGPGMTFSELIEDMIEHEKKRRLVEDIKRIQETEELVEIPL